MQEKKQPVTPVLTPAQKRVQQLEIKLKQAKALAQKQANAIKHKEQAANRQIETRKRVLLGAFMLSGGDPLQLVNGAGQSLAEWLTRDDERALFGLDPVNKKAEAM